MKVARHRCYFGLLWLNNCSEGPQTDVENLTVIVELGELSLEDKSQMPLAAGQNNRMGFVTQVLQEDRVG